eukprot:GHRQ01011195.1.p3 GENE.GHRQ01011195.1~~GHRQ01011195.1.p3  ORF type:complete len:112 (-),score=13.07 GHRQ01011195.1:559-894(-)
MPDGSTELEQEAARNSITSICQKAVNCTCDKRHFVHHNCASLCNGQCLGMLHTWLSRHVTSRHVKAQRLHSCNLFNKAGNSTGANGGAIAGLDASSKLLASSKTNQCIGSA